MVRSQCILRPLRVRGALEGMRRLGLAAVALGFALLTATTAANAERRVALVIGNGDYAKVSKLPNPPHDANDVEKLLSGAGFDAVVIKRDLGRDAMRRALRDFSDQVRAAD